MPSRSRPAWEDATDVEGSFFRLRDGGVVILDHLQVAFWASAPREAWKGLLASLGSALPGRGELEELAALSPGEKPFPPYLITTVSGHEARDDKLHWELYWARAPQDEAPPRSYHEQSKRAGGFPGVLDRLASSWPGAAQVKVRVSVTYAFPQGCGFLFPPLLAPAKGGLVPTTWRVRPSVGALQRIRALEMLASPPGFGLRGSGTLTLPFTARILNEVDGAIWQPLRTFLKTETRKLRRSSSARRGG